MISTVSVLNPARFPTSQPTQRITPLSSVPLPQSLIGSVHVALCVCNFWVPMAPSTPVALLLMCLAAWPRGCEAGETAVQMHFHVHPDHQGAPCSLSNDTHISGLGYPSPLLALSHILCQTFYHVKKKYDSKCHHAKKSFLRSILPLPSLFHATVLSIFIFS